MRKFFDPRRVLILMLLFGIVGGVAAFWMRGSLLTNYYLQKLDSAAVSERSAYLESIAKLSEESFPAIARALQSEDSSAARGALLAVPALASGWGMDDILTRKLAVTLIGRFPALSPSGQLATIELVDALIDSTTPEQSAHGLQCYVAVLTGASVSKKSTVKKPVLALLEKRLELSKRAEILPQACQLIRTCLKDADSSNRLQALRLAPRLSRQLALDGVVLLTDPNPEIRRVALLALAADTDLIGTDDLLRWLHDSDAEVRRLCEQALKGRGLSEAHIRLGRLLTSEQPATRLEVLEQLRRNQDLDPGVWLRRLSHDPAPAVRAAALRAAVDNPDIDLRDRIEQMIQNDPSSTVRQLAQFYLSARKSNRTFTLAPKR